MKYARIIGRLFSVVILSLGLGGKSAEAADLHLCWLFNDGFGDIEVVDLYFSSVAPATFSIAGKSFVVGEPEIGIMTGAAVLSSGKLVGHLSVNGSEAGADGLLFVGQFRFILDLSTAVMTTEGIGTEYYRETGESFTEYEANTFNPFPCPS